MRRHGERWASATTTILIIQMAGRRCSSDRWQPGSGHLALDPDFSDAAGQLITNRVETGELSKAYKDAKALVARHPENATAHFALSYVLRYGGMLQEAAQECDTALSLDPGNYQFRSCSLVFDLLGNPERGMEFLRLDLGSAGSRSIYPSISHAPATTRRHGRARESADRHPFQGRLVNACFNGAPCRGVGSRGSRLHTHFSC